MVKNDFRREWKSEVMSSWREWNESVTESEKRVKFTHYLAKAWEKMKGRQKTVIDVFFSCGIMVRIDGSDDCLIKLRGAPIKLIKTKTGVRDTGTTTEQVSYFTNLLFMLLGLAISIPRSWYDKIGNMRRRRRKIF